LRIEKNRAEVSLAFQEAISGSFMAGAGPGRPGIPVNAINLVLKTKLK
jgi:hypothetical protein